MKKLIKVVLMSMVFVFCISSLLVCGCFGSCKNDGKMGRYDNPWVYRQEEAGFYYYIDTYHHEQDSAVILGIVDEEKEIDELVIPETLGGCLVVQIGEHYDMWYSGQNDYGINAKNIKNIVLNFKVKLLSIGINNFSGNLVINYPIDLVLGYTTCDWYKIDDRYHPENKIEYYIGIKSIQYRYFCTFDTLDYFNLYSYNIFYDANDGEQIVWAVKIPKGNILADTGNPKKDGYKFGGWYMDENLEIEWNFENIVTENMTLYAKWI